MALSDTKIRGAKTSDMTTASAISLTSGNRNRATLAVARRLVAYMLAVDKKQADFKLPAEMQAA